MNEPMYSPELEELLLQSGMHPDLIDMAWHTDQFRREMRLGLTGPASSLAMLPTYLSTDGVLPADTPVLVIDAGGSNLRLARVSFSAGGSEPKVEELASGKMPGSEGKITRGEYMDRMVGFLRPYLHGDTLIAYCFSYEAAITPAHDGILTSFNKGVQVEDTDGMAVCAALEAALKDAGIPGSRQWVLLNDSTAAACGALYKLRGGAGGTLGFILGTGTNTCYPEKTARIQRYPVADDGGTMLINMESGAYDKFPRGEADRLLDTTDVQPGIHLYEKMVAGVYIGRLIYLTARSAAQRGQFSQAFRTRIEDAATFRAADVDLFIRDPLGDSVPASVCQTDADRKALLTITQRLYERAAKLVTVNLTAVLEEAGFGSDPGHPALIAAEGSSFWKSSLFLPQLKEKMEAFTHKSRGLSFEILSVPHANLIGSAAAALLNRQESSVS